MVLPLIPIIIAGTTILGTVIGAKKHIDASRDNKSAKDISDEAKGIYDRAQAKITKDCAKTQNCLAKLGRLKAKIFSNHIKHLVDMHPKFHSSLSGYDESFTMADLERCKSIISHNSLTDLVASCSSAAATGALAAIGAYGTAGAIGTASTGTAIASLSGAAATNATLSWLGGGALAAGGLGMAGGAVVLGGIALGPIVAVSGFSAAAKAKENLTNAQKYEADVAIACEKIKEARVRLRAIRSSCKEMALVIIKLADLFDRHRVNSMDDMEAFQKMLLIGKHLKEILDEPVLGSDGAPLPNIKARCSGYLEFGRSIK